MRGASGCLVGAFVVQLDGYGYYLFDYCPSDDIVIDDASRGDACVYGVFFGR